MYRTILLFSIRLGSGHVKYLWKNEFNFIFNFSSLATVSAIIVLTKLVTSKKNVL